MSRNLREEIQGIIEYCNDMESQIECESSLCIKCSKSESSHCPKWFSRMILESMGAVKENYFKIENICRASSSDEVKKFLSEK